MSCRPLSARELEIFSDRLGSEVYLDIIGWHLYLGDIRNPPLAHQLAVTLAPLLHPAGIPNLREVLTGIPIPVGGGKHQLSLWDCLPATSVRHLEHVVAQVAQETL